MLSDIRTSEIKYIADRNKTEAGLDTDLDRRRLIQTSHLMMELATERDEFFARLEQAMRYGTITLPDGTHAPLGPPKKDE